MEEVISRLGKAGLKLSAKKCHFFRETVRFLGHIVSGDGISTDPEKTRVVEEWPQPTNVTEVKSFLGTCSYYRRFIDHFSEIAKPLHQLTMKGISFVWGQDCDQAFRRLKQAITSAPILSYPASEGQFILDTDASQFSVGAVLTQVQEGEEKVIAYYSQALSKEERNYCTTRRELLAVVKGVKHFHHYLYREKFVVGTDHGSLAWLIRFKNPEGQLARWLEILGIYDMKIEFRPGRLHGNADGLSRIPCNHCTHCSAQEERSASRQCLRVLRASCARERRKQQYQRKFQHLKVSAAPIPAPGSTQQNTRQAQLDDPDIGPILQAKEKEEPRPLPDEVLAKGPIFKHYWRQWERLEVKNGILHRVWFNDNKTSRLQIIVPQQLRPMILKGLHDDPAAGHMGIRRTNLRVRNSFYWVGYHLDVIDWCQKCKICQARKFPGKKARAPLKNLQTGARFQRVSLDILGPLPTLDSGNSYILLITDYFSKWAEAVPMPNMEAATVAQGFMDQFITKFGVPAQIHSDQGRQFTSKLFQEMCTILEANKTQTTPYWPQSDGLVERLNRTLEDILSKLVSANQRDWDLCLQIAMMAYRSSTQESTAPAPAFMLFGSETA